MPQHTRKRKNEFEMEVAPPKHKLKSSDAPPDDPSNFLKRLEDAELKTHTTQHVLTPDSGIGDDEIEFTEEPAWFDEDDDGIDVGVALDSQGRKLPRGGINDRSNQYTSLLKNKFEAIVGTPKWALLRKEKDLDPDDELLQSCGFIKETTKQNLPPSTLELKKVKDLNCETYSEGVINCIEFHPGSTAALVAGNHGIATLFAVDGKHNNKLHSVAFERFPILCARFMHNGDEVLLGSRRAHIYSYDLIAAKPTRIPLPHGLTQAKKFEISPDMHFIAVAGKWGEVHLLRSSTKERIAILKQDAEVTALSFSPTGSVLYAHSNTGEVTMWDMNMRRVRHCWIDEGCLQGSSLAVSSSNQFIAAGSSQGIVNVYGVEDVVHTQVPKPRKTIFNLTTAITDVAFNSTSETFGFFSSDVESAVRLFHIGSGTVFNNFPVFGSKLGYITAVSFSPGSGYVALGNKKSTVALYRLKHFKNY